MKLRRSQSEGLGLVFLVFACAGLAVLGWLAQALLAFFATPIPWIALLLVAAGYGLRQLRRQRLRKRLSDAVATLHGHPQAPADAFHRLVGDQSVPDVMLLLAVRLAHEGDHDGAYGWLRHMLAQLDTKVRPFISPLLVQWPSMVEPLWVGADQRGAANLSLLAGVAGVNAGKWQALPMLEERLHAPHFAAALGALCDAYMTQGNAARAAGVMQHHQRHVTEPTLRWRLDYKLAGYLEACGAQRQALTVWRHLGAWGDAPANAQRLATQLAAADAHAAERGRQAQEARRRAQEQRLVERDADIYEETVHRIELAKGPRSREKALEWGRARLTQPHMLERLLLRASELEVEAVLDRVAGLKTKRAKINNLEKALAQLTRDELPDSLQAHEIALLKRALHALISE